MNSLEEDASSHGKRREKQVDEWQESDPHPTEFRS